MCIYIHRKYASIRTIYLTGGAVFVEYKPSPWLIVFSRDRLESIDEFVGWPLIAHPVWAQLGKVDNSVVDALTRLSTLRTVSSYEDCTASGKTFCRLACLKRIERLTVCIKGDSADDNLIKTACSWPKLNCLHLTGSQVTDAGVAYCASMTSLAQLYIDGRQVSDCGIASLANCRNLELLALGPDIVVSENAIEELKRRCRGLKILRH